jgi:hypothetical protein
MPARTQAGVEGEYTSSAFSDCPDNLFSLFLECPSLRFAGVGEESTLSTLNHRHRFKFSSNLVLQALSKKFVLARQLP